MITRWRYYYRRYLGWLPIQFCMTCGRWYWGGLPRIGIINRPLIDWKRDINGNPVGGKVNVKLVIGFTWQASWKEYCSQNCCDEDPIVKAMDAMSKAAAEEEQADIEIDQWKEDKADGI